MEDVKKVIQFRVFNEYENFQIIEGAVEKIFENVYQLTAEKNIDNKSIKLIIVTDDILTVANEQGELWKTSVKLNENEKGYGPQSILIQNIQATDLEFCCIFSLFIFFQQQFSPTSYVLRQVLHVYAHNMIPAEILKPLEYKAFRSLIDSIKFYIIDWCKTFYVTNLMVNTFKREEQFISPNILIDNFKRRMKKSIYKLFNSPDYEDNQLEWELFLQTFLLNLEILITNLLEYPELLEEFPINEEEPCFKSLHDVIKQITKLIHSFVENNSYDYEPLKNSIIALADDFDITLKEEGENTYVKLKRDPKDYFTGELVETEPRFVCFMDILGFTNQIYSYEADKTSTVLQKIQRSFKDALAVLNYSESSHLQFQMFSDNICISLPYFENLIDFQTVFEQLCLYVRTFQFSMMREGFFMRGGISFGSYYADENIIFSQALVNAYTLEKDKAIYPRIIVDRNIIATLLKHHIIGKISFLTNNSIIVDSTGEAFLNPFGLTKTSIQYLDYIVNQINKEPELLDLYSPEKINKIKSYQENGVKDFNSKFEAELDDIKKITSIVADNAKTSKTKSIYDKYFWLMEYITWCVTGEKQSVDFNYLDWSLESEKLIDYFNKEIISE